MDKLGGLDVLQNFPNGKAHGFNRGMIVRW